MHLRQTFRAIHFNEAYLLISNSGVRINCQPRQFLFLSCGVKWSGSGVDPMDHLSYVAYIYTFGFIVPVTIIFTSYYKIIKTVKYKVRGNPDAASRLHTAHAQASLIKATGGVKWQSPSNKSRQERDRRLTSMVAVMIISFLAIWMPYACTSLMETAGYQPDSPLSYTVLAVPTMLVKSAVCIDPIIYFGLNPQFRGEMVKTLTKLFSRLKKQKR